MTDDPTPAGLTAADERHHPVGEGEWWNESWYFDFATADGSLGGYVRIGLYPHRRACWYWACLVGEGRPLVMVVDHDVAPPRAGSLELRAEGLWADHNVEVPFDHMTLGCEAFALGLDDPAGMYDADPRGERVPFGLDLEWDTDGAAYAYPEGTTRYEVPCRVHGEVLVGDESIALDAIGQRDHSWGTRDWWALGWTWTSGALDDGTRFHGTVARLGDDPLPYHPGYVQPPGGPLAGVTHTATAAVLGPQGLPTSATFDLDDLHLAIAPVAFAPVLLEDGTGRVSRFPRALCRFSDPAGGRSGVGWTEWNQPSA
ncbi:MAG TPA: hypothetical protein VKB57_01565 [Acidimicrobiales bacterium]|nr:hypothetical protein [Acidimicrobiales bacterium]